MITGAGLDFNGCSVLLKGNGGFGSRLIEFANMALIHACSRFHCLVICVIGDVVCSRFSDIDWLRNECQFTHAVMPSVTQCHSVEGIMALVCLSMCQRRRL